MRLDWQKIRALSLDAGLQNSDKALFVLPVAGRDLLMSIFERFTWRATFRTEGYDFADWDALQAIVMETENGLMGTILMDDLTEQLDRIATALEGCCTIPILTEINQTIGGLELSPVVNVTGGGGGCGNVFETWRVPVGWEDDFPENPIPDDDTPTTEASGDLCDAAHSAHYEIRQWFQAFAENVGAESPYTEIVEYMNLFALVNKSTAWMYHAMTSVITLWYDNLLEDVDEFWMDIKNEFICAVLQYDNAVDLRAWLFERIRTNPPTWSAGMYMETLLTGTTFNIIYDGTYVPFPQFIGSDCDICNNEPPVSNETYEWRAGTGVQTVTSPHTTLMNILPDAVEANATIPTTATTWAPTVVFSPPEIEAGEELVGYTHFIYRTETSGGVNDPSNGSVRVSGDSSLGNYRKLWYKTGFSEISALATFDFTDEDNAAQIEADRSIALYARVGTGQTPPGFAEARVYAILWCVKLAT